MMNTVMILMAMQYINVPYKWGGSNVLGIDCSGLVLKVLHDSGLTLVDQTADQLYRYCLEIGVESGKRCDSLIFFGSKERITHVGISLGVIDGDWYMINASGAGRNSLTMSKEELAERDARVKIQKVSSRKDVVASILIPYKG
jgi:cell wall-associated NlpC family hydrolase